MMRGSERPECLRWRLAPALSAALAFAFLLGLVGAGYTQGGRKDEGLQTSAPFAILIEASNGNVIFEKNADQLMAPASLAKLMTAAVVFREIKAGRLKLADELKVGENAWRRGGGPSGSSSMYAELNSRVPVSALLRGMIIQSGNDSSITLAEAIAGDEAKFAAMMTAHARELGLQQSVFGNSTGLPDPPSRVTARELARLAQHIIAQYPEFYPIYGEREFTWNGIRQANRNPLLTVNIGADGLKTGSTKEAGYGLVASAVQNGMRLIVVVNGLKSAKERADEARRLLEFGFRAFEQRVLFKTGEQVGEARVFGGMKTGVSLQAERDVQLLTLRTGSEKVTGRVVYAGPLQAPIEAGARVGTLKIWRDNRLALEIPVRAGESIARGSLPRRAFDAAAELVTTVFRSNAERL